MGILRNVRRLTLLAALPPLLLASCGGGPEAPCATDACHSLTFVSRSLGFVKHPDSVGAPNVIEGFDLDGMVTTDQAEGCYKPDQVAPDGTPGIDNAGGSLFELVAAFTKDGLEGLVQTAVNQGALLLIVRIEGVDDTTNDDAITLRLYSGTGTPQLGSDDRIAPNQTFAVDDSVQSSVAEGRIVDGVLEAGPFDAVIPFQVGELREALRLHGGRVRGRITADGQVEDAMFGGGIEIVQIASLAEAAGRIDFNASQITGLVPYIVDPAADLAPDEEGVCRQLSAALDVDLAPAYLLNDPFRGAP